MGTIAIRRSDERGHFDHGWLDTYHTFSFGDYHDPAHVRFRTLRVMNEDRVQPGRGFGMHGHKDMEIVTYVLEGALEHRDSLGNGSVLRAGDLQRMTAGTGIRHSEFNPSDTEPLHLYQIWLLPERTGLTPSYEELPRDGAVPENQLRLVASREGKNGSLTIHQDARIHLATLTPGGSVQYVIEPGRYAWLQTLRGDVRIGEVRLTAGDGAAISEQPEIRGPAARYIANGEPLTVTAETPVEVMLFDLG